jgi:FkbM family methyltransferase
MNYKYIRKNTTPNASYTQNEYISHIPNKEDIKYIVEAGSRDLLDALELEKIYPNALILSFECNPECIEICKHNLQYSQGRIQFFTWALSNKNDTLDFYSFNSDVCPEHDAGVSSLYLHINPVDVPMKKIQVEARTLSTVLYENNIPQVDMLCLDLQGGEYDLLLGMEAYINTVKYMIVEFDSDYYQNAPKKDTLYNFIKNNNFIPVYTGHDTIFKRL